MTIPSDGLRDRPGRRLELVPTPETAPRSLCSGFLRASEEHPGRPALEVGGVTRTYAELRERATTIAATLQRHAPADDPPLTALFAARTATAYEGVLGVLMRGHGYVPLGVKFPAARNREILERAGCRAVVVDAARVPALDELLDGVAERLVVVAPDVEDGAELAARHPRHTILAAPDLAPAAELSPPAPDPDAIAYLLFTSGSTGTPKGVMVAHRNATAFVDLMSERFGVGVDDRVSQAFELTFDVSVFDMFVTWGNGACLCVPTEAALMSPARFIRDNALTIWYSVPTIGQIMRRLGALKPGAFPSLRWSLFAGEPLTVEMAREWAAAAPNSTVENLYGPTELTVTCVMYRWDPERIDAEAENGVVPIGWANPNMRAIVVDEELRPVAPGAEGELLMTGEQLTLGYWRDPERTAAAFVVPPGEDDVFYRTGDRVRSSDGRTPITYLGRIDHQIKVHGYRVELGEIEAALRDATGNDAVIAVGWPRTPGGAGGIVAFAGDAELDVAATLEQLRARLPVYMVPRTIHRLDQLPLNPSGKYDRRALLDLLEQGTLD